MAAALCLVGALVMTACSTVKGTAPQAQAPQPAQAIPVIPQITKVALLLPLSGNNATIGQGLLDAAQLALFDIAADRYELMPRDTKGTPQGAADAARTALAEGAQVILGPLFAPEVAAVKPIARAANVEVLAFSTDASLAGDGTYILGFVPSDQVDRVVGFARSRGVTRFAALAPRTGYGEAVVTAFQAAAQRFGGQVVQVERYEQTASDPATVARPVAQSGAGPQAVLLAEGGARVKQLAGALGTAGLNPQQVKLLGTGLWDEPGLGQEPALVGAWFAAPATAQRATFEADFEKAYGRKPPRIATLAYDAVAMTAIQSKLRGPGAVNRAALTAASGFEGIDGLFRLRPSGAVERGLAVLEVTPDGARVIDPAPTTFAVMGQ